MTREHRRAMLLDSLADYLLAYGLGAASLRPMAAAAGTSDRMLLYYFTDRDTLLAAALDAVSARLVAILDRSDTGPRAYATLLSDVWQIFRAPAFRPYLKLWLEVATRAADGTEPFRTIGGRIADGFLGWASDRLAIPDAAERHAAAALLLATIDGLALLEAVGRGDDADAAVTFASS